MKFKQEIDSFIVTALLALLPAFMLSIGHTSAIFYALLVVSLTICFSRIGGFAATKNDWLRYKWLAAGLFFMLFVVVLVMLIEVEMHASAIERALRIGAGTFLVLGACLSLKPNWLRQAAWGMAVTAVVSAAISWWLAWPGFSRPDVPEYNAVSYGNLALLVTTMTAFSLGWKLTPFRKTEIIIKILIVAFGLSGFILTQTRSGWLATPFFVLFALILLKDLYKPKTLVVGFVIAMAGVVAIFSSSSTLVSRAQLAVNEFKECINNPLNTNNTCVRIQLWRGSWELFKENPILGIQGGEHFNEELQRLIDKKIIAKSIVEQGFGEPHNDLFYMLASYGLLGLIAILLIYVSPGVVFARRLFSPYSMEIRVGAAMGLSVCVGFLVFGLTETMFRGMRTMGFYAVTIAWLLALSDPIFLQRETVKKPIR